MERSQYNELTGEEKRLVEGGQGGDTDTSPLHIAVTAILRKLSKTGYVHSLSCGLFYGSVIVICIRVGGSTGIFGRKPCISHGRTENLNHWIGYFVTVSGMVVTVTLTSIREVAFQRRYFCPRQFTRRF